MRIGKVVGRVTLNRAYDTLVGGRFLIVEVQDRFALGGEKRRTTESLAESREACMPFYPEKRVPLDAYNAAILDRVAIDLRE
jgi:hypothetical protein